MAIKISNNTVIDDSRNFIGVGVTLTGPLYANTNKGTSGQVLTSTGSAVQWKSPASVSIAMNIIFGL